MDTAEKLNPYFDVSCSKQLVGSTAWRVGGERPRMNHGVMQSHWQSDTRPLWNGWWDQCCSPIPVRLLCTRHPNPHPATRHPQPHRGNRLLREDVGRVQRDVDRGDEGARGDGVAGGVQRVQRHQHLRGAEQRLCGGKRNE